MAADWRATWALGRSAPEPRLCGSTVRIIRLQAAQNGLSKRRQSSIYKLSA